MNKLSNKVLTPAILLILISSILTLGWVIYNTPSETYQDNVVMKEDVKIGQDLALNNFISDSIAEIQNKLGITEYQIYDIKLSQNNKRTTYEIEVNITYVVIDGSFGVDTWVQIPGELSDDIKEVIYHFFSKDASIAEMGYLGYDDNTRYTIYPKTLIWSFFDGYPEGEAGEGAFQFGDPFMSSFLMYSGNDGLDFINFDRR